MPGYRAGSGGGMFGSSVYPDSRPRIDVGGALDALGHSAESLINQAYSRKLNEAQLARQARLDAQEREQTQWQRSDADRRFQFEQAKHATDIEHQNAAAIAGLLPQGFEVDDGPSLTASAYGTPGPAAASAQAGGAAAAPRVKPHNPLADVPGYQPKLQDVYESRVNPASPINTPTVATPAAPIEPPAKASPSITIGGKRLVYKGYGASAKAQEEQSQQAFNREMEKARAGDARALENLRYMHEQNLVPMKAKAEIGAMLEKQAPTRINQILDDYHRDSAEFEKARSGYEVLKGALKKPGIATPFSVLDAYARVVNPGAVVRQGTMQTLKEMGSVDQKVARWLKMTQEGTWPPEMIESIKNTIDGIMQEHYQSYKQGAHSRALQRGKAEGVDVAQYLMPTMPEFEPKEEAPPAAGGGGNIDLRADAAAAPPRRVGPPPRAPNGAQLEQQRKDYDAAASHLKAAGKKDSEIRLELGARP